MPRTNRRNYYRLLHVQHDAPVEVIRASYRAIMQKLKQHPDLGGDAWNASLLNKAYSVLSNEVKRAAYDRQRAGSDPERRGRPTAAAQQTRREASTQHGRNGPAYCPFCQVSAPGKAHYGSVNTHCRVCKSPLTPVKAFRNAGNSKRAVKRTSIKGQVNFLSSWPQTNPETAEVHDLSPLGLRFVSSKKRKPNSLLKFDSPSLEAVGRVVSCIRSDVPGTPGYLVGVAFITLEFRDKKGTFVSAQA